MMSLNVDLALNPRGTDPTAALYQAITTQYPQFGITQETTVIRQLIAHPTKLNPDRTRLVIADRDQPALTYMFFYDRVNINRLLKNPVFDAEQLQQALVMDDKQLLTFIGTLYNLNLTEADFFVATSGVSYVGGNVTPNWRLKARFDSVFFHSELVVHLHDGSPLPEDPVDPEHPVDPEEPPSGTTELMQVFPTYQIGAGMYSSQYWHESVSAVIGHTLVFEEIDPEIDDRGYFPLPDMFSLNGDLPPIGSEYRIFNNTNHPIYLNMSSYNIVYASFGYSHYVQPGVLLRMVYLGVDPNNGYMRWSMIGDYTAEKPQ